MLPFYRPKNNEAHQIYDAFDSLIKTEYEQLYKQREEEEKKSINEEAEKLRK